MTLMKCDECGGDVSSEAKACPKCGAKPRQSGNGFGGMTNEHITVAKGKASRDASAWNKYCANKPLNDMIHVRQALR